MTPTPLYQGPTAAQLFGSNYVPEYVNHLPEQVQFEKPIALIPDFTRTKQLIKEFVHKYDLQLKEKYPDEPGRNGKLLASRSYTIRRLNSGTMATLDALLEMYGAYCIASANGHQVRESFTIRPSAIMSRRYGAVRSANTINEHLYRLEESGLIKMSELLFDQCYKVSFNKEVLAARADKTFTKIIVDNILNSCPQLATNPDFQEWSKRLKPSFFAIPSEGGTQFLRAYMCYKIHNSNIPESEFVDKGETKFSPHPPSFTRSKGAPENHASGAVEQGTTLGAKFSPEKEEKNNQEVIHFQADRCWDIAKTFSFWKDKKYTREQIALCKKYLCMWIQNFIAENSNKGNYAADVFLPALRNQERSLSTGKYQWRPPSPDIYFSPQFLTDYGRPAGYRAAVIQWEKIIHKKNIRQGTRKKNNKIQLKEKIFMRWFNFFARIPTVKNMRKAEENILMLKDNELTQIFYDALISSNLLPTEKLIEETEKKLKQISKNLLVKNTH